MYNKSKGGTLMNDIIISLAGNPNVGKSTFFNNITGMSQHTGNWAGKTVENAKGRYKNFVFVDLPGTYSLMSHSKEEEVARDYICFGKSDYTIVVCDATNLERNLNLVLQVLEITPNVLVLVNLNDEAEKKGIYIDEIKLSKILGVPVKKTSARKDKHLKKIPHLLTKNTSPYLVDYESLENSIKKIKDHLDKNASFKNTRWLSIKLLENDENFLKSYEENTKENPFDDVLLKEIVYEERKKHQNITDTIVSQIVKSAENIAKSVTTKTKSDYSYKDRKLDNIFCGKYTAVPIMLLMLGVILWITIVGANYPSQWLSEKFTLIENIVRSYLINIGTNSFICGMVVDGLLKVMFWVVAVMLPPMAIFFPLFSLLEDSGILPRIAFNTDKYFQRAKACGKQCLCMCMGLGCNAVGVTGCRIIDSPRERLIAILTNNFIPCNGRFPTLILLSMAFFCENGGLKGTLISALILIIIVGTGVFFTLISSYVLSKTLLKGEASSFTLELPPYRTPQFFKTIINTVKTKIIFVLGRAISVAAPAGVLIFVLNNISINGTSLLVGISRVLDLPAKLIGLDGTILLSFILGFPANEIVLPIAVMIYLSASGLSDISDVDTIHSILTANGWTYKTAICTMLFSLLHWPCSTTLLTAKKESGSFYWSFITFIVPTICGILLCFVINMFSSLF